MSVDRILMFSISKADGVDPFITFSVTGFSDQTVADSFRDLVTPDLERLERNHRAFPEREWVLGDIRSNIRSIFQRSVEHKIFEYSPLVLTIEFGNGAVSKVRNKTAVVGAPSEIEKERPPYVEPAKIGPLLSHIQWDYTGEGDYLLNGYVEGFSSIDLLNKFRTRMEHVLNELTARMPLNIKELEESIGNKIDRRPLRDSATAKIQEILSEDIFTGEDLKLVWIHDEGEQAESSVIKIFTKSKEDTWVEELKTAWDEVFKPAHTQVHTYLDGAQLVSRPAEEEPELRFKPTGRVYYFIDFNTDKKEQHETFDIFEQAEFINSRDGSLSDVNGEDPCPRLGIDVFLDKREAMTNIKLHFFRKARDASDAFFKAQLSERKALGRLHQMEELEDEMLRT